MRFAGGERDEILAEGQRPAGRASSEPLRAVLSGAYLQKSRDEISSSGYVIATMEAALWAFAHAADFESGALMAVNLGHDADTVGAGVRTACRRPLWILGYSDCVDRAALRSRGHRHDRYCASRPDVQDRGGPRDCSTSR